MSEEKEPESVELRGTDGPTCRTCPFAYDVDDPRGECHREPPTIVEMVDEYDVKDYVGVWPTINADADWCGEHPGRKLTS